MLYSRTLVVLLVKFYTSRIILQVLGVEDYGIYNVVGGIVVMFSFISSTLGSASQRYIAYELPRNDQQRLNETFGLIKLSYGIVSLITLLGSEIIGVWFLNTHMNIPECRMVAANWVLQAAIFGFLFNIFTVPYMSLMIAHEHMNIYAYMSIFDAILKLITAYLLRVLFYDGLIVYAVLTFICTFIISVYYRLYCKRHYPESHCSFFFNKERLIDITSFAWWNMVGVIANLLRGQGVNIMLNMFFNPTINAARAVAYQVNTAVNSLSHNIYTALRPQITKSYSVGDVNRMHTLIYSSSRLSFCLMLILSLPIFVNTEKVLSFWLGSYPEYSVVFLKLVLICSLLEVFSMPLVAGLQATGEIKGYQMIVSGTYLINLPISYILLSYGFGPEYPIYVNMFLVLFCMIPRIILCHKHYKLNFYDYSIGVLLRCFVFSLIGFIIGYHLNCYFNTDNLLWFIVSFISNWLLACIISVFFIINRVERQFLFQLICKRLKF